MLSDDFIAGMVDTIFADVAQPDQARIVAFNAHHFLKNEGHVVISIKVKICTHRAILKLLANWANILYTDEI